MNHLETVSWRYAGGVIVEHMSNIPLQPLQGGLCMQRLESGEKGKQYCWGVIILAKPADAR